VPIGPAKTTASARWTYSQLASSRILGRAGELEGFEEVGQVGEGDEARIVGEGGDPGEEGSIGAIRDWDAGFCRREVDGQVSVDAELGRPGKGGQGGGLKRKAAENKSLGGEQERARILGARAGGRPVDAARTRQIDGRSPLWQEGLLAGVEPVAEPRSKDPLGGAVHRTPLGRWNARTRLDSGTTVPFVIEIPTPQHLGSPFARLLSRLHCRCHV
jgi:hypothetical protein